jgi:hypothetical protein
LLHPCIVWQSKDHHLCHISYCNIHEAIIEQKIVLTNHWFGRRDCDPRKTKKCPYTDTSINGEYHLDKNMTVRWTEVWYVQVWVYLPESVGMLVPMKLVKVGWSLESVLFVTWCSERQTFVHSKRFSYENDSLVLWKLFFR